MDADHQDLVAQFVTITGADPASAQGGLQAANWNLQEAVQLYFAAQEDPQDENDDVEPAASSSAYPPTLAQPGSSEVPTQERQRRNHKQMTLDDLKKKSSDHEADEDDDQQQDMFAGGEKSGLAVQNPDQNGPADHFKNIMKQAQQNRERPSAPGEQPEPPRESAFQGRAQTLGGEGTESQVVEDPLQRVRDRMAARQRERVTRTMHLWADGVSIDDGPLFRFDDPANQGMMQEINRGRAPLQLLDVQQDQEVDLNLEPHKDENYVQPTKKYKPFAGSGQRLGSPTPGPDPSSSSTPAATSQPAAAAATSTPSNTDAAMQEVDESVPTLQLQVRLGDGTRLSSRFNTSHTIGDVYAFVNRASAESTQRPYALMTTFPSKELDDKSQVLGEMSDFKRGGVVVQKWK